MAFLNRINHTFLATLLALFTINSTIFSMEESYHFDSTVSFQDLAIARKDPNFYAEPLFDEVVKELNKIESEVEPLFIGFHLANTIIKPFLFKKF